MRLLTWFLRLLISSSCDSMVDVFFASCSLISGLGPDCLRSLPFAACCAWASCLWTAASSVLMFSDSLTLLRSSATSLVLSRKLSSSSSAFANRAAPSSCELLYSLFSFSSSSIRAACLRYSSCTSAEGLVELAPASPVLKDLDRSFDCCDSEGSCVASVDSAVSLSAGSPCSSTSSAVAGVDSGASSALAASSVDASAGAASSAALSAFFLLAPFLFSFAFCFFSCSYW